MPTATLTTKGQITIPKSVRIALGLQAGSRLDFVRSENGYAVIPARVEAATPLKGRFAGRNRQPVSIKDMNQAIADEASGGLGIGR